MPDIYEQLLIIFENVTAGLLRSFDHGFYNDTLFRGHADFLLHHDLEEIR